MTFEEIMALPVEKLVLPTAHLYLWCPNALLPQGLEVMKAWGFSYKSNIVWHKIRKDGGSDGRGVGFYFRNVTELILFGVKEKRADACAGTTAGEFSGDSQARALAQTGRAIRAHRDMLAPALPRALRSRYAQGLDQLG